MANIYKKKGIIFSIFSLMFFLIFQSFILAQSGSIQGTVKDKNTGEGLPGANVVIKGTSLGAATDLDGKFIIRNLPVGKLIMEISYVGYISITADVIIAANKTLEENFSLEAKTLEGQTVTVTAQARGQLSAINQQLSSSNLVNVVSAEKMQELPDANLAESIGRLPGISLERNAGEAYAVTIRGLSPQYNEVLIEGVPMVSTNYADRGVDLSLMSDNLIKGVEVSKTLQADMDANALGGAVNLTLRTAPSGLHYNVWANGGYNKLRDTYKNYKFVGGISNRFLDDKIGILFQGNIEQKQLPSDRFNAAYATPSYDANTKQFSVQTSSAQVGEYSTERHRYGISLILDYTSDLVDLKFFNVYDQKNDSNFTRTFTSFFISPSFQDTIGINETKTIQETHALQALFKLGNTELPITFAYTKGSEKVPGGQQFIFYQTNVPPLSANTLIYGKPADLINSMGVMDPVNNPTTTTLFNMAINNISLTDESYDLKIDWKAPFKLSDSFSGNLKIGGKYHSVKRTSERTQDYNYILYGAGAGNRGDLIATFPFLKGAANTSAGIGAVPFIDPSYTRKNILGYPIGPGFNMYRLVNMQTSYYYGDGTIPSHEGIYYTSGPNDFNQDYTDKENSLAGYIMFDLNIGNDLSIVPGIRYQDEKTDISAYHIGINLNNQDGLQSPPVLVNSKRDFPAWYPSINIKYKATSNVQILGAIYKSESLPGYNDISPLVELQSNAPVITGNPLLKPSTAWNFDLGVSVFSNELGLFTVDGFYKEISNLIYPMQNWLPFTSLSNRPYPVVAPAGVLERLPGVSYYDTSFAKVLGVNSLYASIPINDPNKAYLRGIEFSWQTHLWYLPWVLNGLVIDLNVSFMSSNQQYPSFQVVRTGGTVFNPEYTLYYQTVEAHLQNQPNSIYNAIIGWDYKGFSARVSFRYQGLTLTSVDTKYGLENSYYDNVLLTDISVKQEIIDGLSVFANATNINNHIDNYYFSHPEYVSTATYPAGDLPTSGQTYGWALQFGVTYSY